MPEDEIRQCYLCKRWFWKVKLAKVVTTDMTISFVYVCERCVNKLETGVKEKVEGKG